MLRALPALLSALFIAALLIMTALSPKRDFSETENRYLADFPPLSVSSLLSGDFTEDFELWLSDAFALRDGWVELRASAELAAGRRLVGGCFYLPEVNGGSLAAQHTGLDPERAEKNVSAAASLGEKLDVPVYMALIPEAATVYAEQLPYGAPEYDAPALLEELSSRSGWSGFADIYPALREKRGGYIFYRGDHHWTTAGAYLGYRAICACMGIEPQEEGSFSPETVSDSFRGTLWSSSGVRFIPPDNIERWAAEPQPGALYKDEFLAVKDKYSYFLGGVAPLRVLEGRGQGRLLVVRDSFADCLLPFLLEHFSEIHVLDPRYMGTRLSDYCGDTDFDAVLFVYSLSVFLTDGSIGYVVA